LVTSLVRSLFFQHPKRDAETYLPSAALFSVKCGTGSRVAKPSLQLPGYKLRYLMKKII
jgi:hypothetical protein